jgi:hypothetical protein
MKFVTNHKLKKSNNKKKKKIMKSLIIILITFILTFSQSNFRYYNYLNCNETSPFFIDSFNPEYCRDQGEGRCTKITCKSDYQSYDYYNITDGSFVSNNTYPLNKACSAYGNFYRKDVCSTNAFETADAGSTPIFTIIRYENNQCTGKKYFLQQVLKNCVNGYYYTKIGFAITATVCADKECKVCNGEKTTVLFKTCGSISFSFGGFGFGYIDENISGGRILVFNSILMSFLFVLFFM